MKNFSPRTQGLIAINAAAVIFGSAALYGKLDVSPFWIVAMRTFFGALTLFLFCAGKRDMPVLPRALIFDVILTGFIIALHWLTFFSAVQWGGVAVATLTFATFPLFTVIIEALHKKRKPYPAEIVAAVTIIVAVGLLVGPHGGSHTVLGAIAGLAAAVTCALFYHTSKRLNATLPSRHVSFWQNAAAAIMLLPFLPFAAPMPAVAMDWAWLILLGVVNTAIMLQMYLYALKRISASTCSGFVALEPVYAIFFAALFFHEPITLWVVVSAALIIGASITLLRLESSS